MRRVEDYSDEELQRLLAKTVGQQGGKDRAAMIQSILDARGVSVEDARTSFLQGLANAPQPSGDDQAQ
jgi:hypothetical protein